MVGSRPHSPENSALTYTGGVVVGGLPGNQILLLRVGSVIEEPLAGLVRYVLVLRVPDLGAGHRELLVHDSGVLKPSDGVALVSRGL